MDADTIAATIADYLGDRDDIATAVVVVDGGANPIVNVTTQAGERYVVRVNPA